MKLRRVEIEGFRGAPKRFELPLDAKSLCVLGENGQGKSTIVDALEFWSSGRIAAFRREGAGIDAAVNLKHGDPAVITCETDGIPTLRRTLNGKQVSDLEPVRLAAVDAVIPSPLPILRHSTMAQFMDFRPGEKKRFLLGLFGLTEVMEFRDALNAAANRARDRATDLQHGLTEDQARLAAKTRGKTPVAAAAALLAAAGRDETVTSERDILALRLDVPAKIQKQADRLGLIENFKRSLQDVSEDPATEWSAAVCDREMMTAHAVQELLKAGQGVLDIWQEDTCPLCLHPHERDALKGELLDRAAALAASEDAFTRARQKVREHKARLERSVDAIRQLEEAAPEGGWPQAEELAALRQSLEGHRARITTALRDQIGYGEPVGFDAARLVTELEEAARARIESGAEAALIKLVELKVTLEHTERRQEAVEISDRVAESVERLRDIAEEELQKAVEQTIGKLGKLAATYYGRLVRSGIYDDIELKYTTARSGGVEFSLRFDGQHRVTPPQRVISESQLNALGLSLFLARLKLEEKFWQTMILDDVINSFDGDHRLSLAALLADEFGEWQILLFTHDSAFAFACQDSFKGWRHKQIVGWSPAGGIILNDGDPLKRLKERLDAGEAAADLGTLARWALERGLSRPLEKLALPIRFDRRGAHSAREYAEALQQGLSDRGSFLKDLPVLGRIKAASYLTNIGAHDRPVDPNVTRNDLHHMVADLDELASGFRCASCKTDVWKERSGEQSFHCSCQKLAV